MDDSEISQTQSAIPAARAKPPSLLEDARSWVAEFGQMMAAFGRWIVANPIHALLLAASIGILVYFYEFVNFYRNYSQSTVQWMYLGWNEINDQEFAHLVPFIFLGLLWVKRKQISECFKAPSNLGLIPIVIGIALFVLGVRALQARLGVLSIPFLIFGFVYFFWGRNVARYFLFPCAFLLFTIPIGALVQMTAHLQLFVAHCVKSLSGLVGIHLNQVGTTFTSDNGGLNFDIADGCSGIHSLMAMAMITSIYVHFTQKQLWKKLLIFAFSLVFAIIGNIGRIFSVVLVANINPKFGFGFYHDYSDYLIFPIGIAAMLGFGALLNLNWKKRLHLSSLKPGGNGKSTHSTYDY